MVWLVGFSEGFTFLLYVCNISRLSLIPVWSEGLRYAVSVTVACASVCKSCKSYSVNCMTGQSSDTLMFLYISCFFCQHEAEA